MMVAKLVALVPLKLNQKSICPSDFLSLSALFAPAIVFVSGLGILAVNDPRFDWIRHPDGYPWEFWLIAVAGGVATLGGIGDWLFHRLYVAAGPRERKSHLLALATGGVPLALLMALASLAAQPVGFLIPIICVVLYTTVLICYDEFQFHSKRCLDIETLMHRFLVFGNCIAWLAWMHWVYVRGGVYGM